MTNPEETPVQFDNRKEIRWQQQVLPETMQIAVDANKLEIGNKLADLLLNQSWNGVEVRGVPDLPDFNLLYTGNTEIDSDEALDLIMEQMRRIRDILGYTKEDLRSIRIIIDPENTGYNGAFAFLNTVEKNLWKKIHRGEGDIAHELGHWVTTGTVHDQRSFPTLLQEGTATWLSAQINEDPQAILDSHLESARGFAAGFGEPGIRIDGEFHNVPAMYTGSVLVDVIVRNLEGDTQRLGDMLRSVDQHENISSWLQSSGINSQQIEIEWKNELFKNDENQDKIPNERRILDLIRR